LSFSFLHNLTFDCVQIYLLCCVLTVLRL
jgi:hypothetical protein